MADRPTTPVVSHDLALHCDDELGHPMAFIATFAYDRADPYAVSLTFHIAQGEVHWLVARSLLLTGLLAPEGEGDVRLRPSLDTDGRPVVEMDFHSPEGRLVVEVSSRDLARFLARTEAEVPSGSESAYVDLDDLAATLLP